MYRYAISSLLSLRERSNRRRIMGDIAFGAIAATNRRRIMGDIAFGAIAATNRRRIYIIDTTYEKTH